MKVSIVIPVYNAEKYLQETIESALNQTYKDIEIIAVNDGSTDNSNEILKKYSNRIKIISKQNGGISSALNAGIKNMQGEWFKQLDSDDLLYPNAVEELITEAQNLKDKNFILYGNYDIIDSNGNLVEKITEPDYNESSPFDFNVILLDHHVGSSTTLMLHKSLIDKCGMFDESLRFKEDYEFRLRYCLLHNCRQHLIPKVLGKIRVHKSQRTKSNVAMSLETDEKIRKSILEKLNPVERERYELALRQYKKNRPIMIKMQYYIRYHILPILPRSISNRIVDAYWSSRKMQKT